MPLRNFNNNQSFIPQEDPDDKLKRIAGMTEYDDWKFAHDRGSIPDSAASVMFVRHGQDISYSSPTMLKDNVRVSYPRSYWNNPQRVARMHEVIDNAPAGWKAPEWLDVEGVENLYRYYEYKNPGKSWEDWNNLSVDDPGIDLANYLDQPPQEYMSNIDQDPAYKQYRAVQDLIDKYNEAQAQIKKAQDAQNQLAIPALQQTYSEQLQAKWSALEPWQQFLMARDSTTPMEGRPEWTYATAAAWSGLKTGWSTYGMAMLAMGAIGAAGGSFAPGIGTAIGAAVGLGVGAYSAYTALNNKENGIAKILNVFNIPAEYTEKIIGVTAIALSQDGKYKFPESMDAKTLLEAGKGAYESQIIPVGNWEANAISWFAHLLNPEWSSGQIAHISAGEVWKIEQGIVTPQVVRGGQLAGEALFQSAIRLNRGEDPTVVYEDMIQNFGYSGTRADFLMQNLLDPAQTIPWIVTKAGGSIAGNIGDSYLRDALAAKQGHLAIDMLPMGWQQIIEGLATKVNPDWHGTGNIFGALQDYGLRLRTSYTPVSGDYIPATDYNKFQMFFGGLTKNNLGEVVVKNLEPYVPDPDKGKIANLAYYLGENTSEAKAVMYSANFTSALERVMAYAGGDPNTFIDMLKSSVSGDDKAFQELAGHYLSSPEMVSIRGGLNDFLNNEKTKTYISIWNATAPKRILLENLAIAASAEDHISIAQVLEMLKTQETSEQLFRWISENPNTENRIVRMVQARIDPNTPNLKASDRITIEGLQERMDKFINGDIVYHPDAMMAKLRNSLEDSIKDHLVDRYGLKTDGFVSRLASLNKAVQSTLLLGLSPSYFANNFVDGMVNLAYNGAYGLMSPGHVAKLWEDMGIPMPSRINEGFGPGSVVASIYDDLNPNDLLSQLHKVVGWGNNKLGIFTALSDKVEKLQGATATTAGFMQYMRGNWKEGVGFGKLPADLEASIRQAGGDPNKLYRLVEQAKTPDEIRDIFAKEILASTRSVRVVLADGTLVSRTQLETIARVHQAVETVGQEIYGDNSAELLSDLIVKTGLDDTIVDNIRQGSTEQEAINTAVTELREAVNIQVTNDIISRIQTDEALISTEGSRIAINILNEMKANYMSRHALLRTQEFTQTADVYELRNKKLFSQADTYYDTFVKNTQDEIKILGEDYIIRLASVLRTLDPDSAVHQPMINGLLTQKNIWDTFYKTKNDMQNEFRMTKHADYEADRDKLIADITRLELKARTDETTQQDIIDHGYLRMLGTNDETRAYVQNWLSKNREMTNTLIEKDRAFFESIAELRKTDPRAAAAAFVKYNIDTYTPYVAKMLEANEAAQAGYDDAVASAQRNREVDAQRGVATEQPVEPVRPTEPIELTTRKAATEAQDTKLKRSLTIDEARQYLYDAETRVKIKAVEDALYDGIKRAFPGSSDAALRNSLDLFRMKADVWAVNNKTTPLDFWKPYTSIENAETMQPPDALAKMILENNSKYGPALNEKDTKVAIDQFLSEAVRARGAVAAAFMAETKRLFPGIKEEQYQFVDSYIDMMANAYAKKYNKTPDDYYKDVWASRELVNDDTKDPISRAMMKYNREGFGLVTFDQYGKALLRTTETADIKTFLHENWNVMSRVMLDPEDIDYIADHYSKGTMTGADFTLNRAKLANGQSLDPEVAKLLNQMEEDLVNDCETLWTKKGADIAPSRLVQLVGKIQQFFKDMYKSLTQRNLDDNPQLEAVLKKIIFPTGEEDPDVKPATHEPVPPDKGQILAATLFKQGNDYRQAIIRGTKAADMQSFIHEMLHTTLYTLRPNELDTLAKYAGFEDGQEYLLYRELRDFNSLDDNPEMAAKLKTGEDKLINEAIDAIGNNKLDSYPASIRNVFVKIKNSLLAIWHKINQQQPEIQWSEDISKAFHSWILGSERDLQAYQMAVDAGMKAKAIATGTAQGPIDLALGNGQTYPTRYTAINLDELKEPFVPINYNSDIKSLTERAERVKIEANEDLILSGFPDVYQEQGDYPVPNYKQAENRLKTLKAELDALGPRPTMTDDVMAFYRKLLTETETIKKNYDDNKTAYPPKLQKQLDTIAQLTADYEKIQNWDAKAAEVMNAEAEYTTLKAKVDTKLSDPDWINRYKNYKDLVVEMSRVTSKYNAIKEGRNQLEIEKVRNMVPKEWFNSNGTQQAINNDDLMILIHPDGRVMYDPNGVRKLLRPYQNPVKNLVFVDKGEPDLSTIGGVILRDYGLTEAQARDTYNRLKSGELTPAQVDKYYYDAGAHDFAINEYHDFKLKNMTRFGLTQEQVDDPNIVVALMPELDYETLAKTSNPGNIYDLWNISATSRTPLVLKPLINNLTEYAKTPEGQTPIANAYISEIATTMEYLPFRDVDGKTKAIIHPTASANDIIEAINAERMAPLINSLPGVLDIIEYATLNSWNSDMIYKLVTDTVSQKVEKFERFTLKNATTGDTYSAATMKNFIAAIDQTIHAQLENSASLGKYDIHGPNINEAVRMPMSEMPDNIKYHINNSLKYFLSNTEYLIANPTPTKLIVSDKPIVEPFYKNAKELSANIADGRVKLSDVQTALIDILANNYNKDNPLQQQLLRLAILDKVNTPEVSYYYRVAPYDIITKRIDQVNGRLDTLTRRLSMGIRNGLSPEAFQNEVKHIEDTIKEYQNGLTIAKEQYELINNKPTQAELTSINKNNLTDAQRQQLSRIKDTTSSDLTKAMNLKKEIARLTAGLEANKALLQSYKDTGTETEPLFYKRNVTELSEEYHRVENLYKDSKELGGLLTGYQKQTIKALLETLKARIDSIRSQRDIYDTDNGKIKTKSKLTADAKLTAARRQAALAQTELEEQTKIQSDAAKNEVMSLAREAVAAGYEGGYKPKMLNSMLDANNYKNKLTEFLKLTINLKENTGDNPFGDLFYKEDQVPDLMRAGITHNLYRLLNEIEKYNANKQDPAYLPPVIKRNMILLATDDIDIRQKDLMSGQKRGIDIIEDVTKRLIDKGVRNLTPYNLLELELLGAEYIAVAETPWHKKSNDPAQRQAIEEFISTFAADDIDYKPSNVATQTVGQRAGVTPVPLETGRANQELLDTHVLPIMDNLKAKLAQDKTDYNTDYVKALTPKEREQLSSWINRTATQLTDTKYNAREWGVMQRDYALLNYKNRTNLDTYMDLIFPYQFWFTRNARNWAMKSLSKPGLIAQVVRREEMMRKNGKGLGKYPKRLQGKMRLPWAFGEDWMGDAIYFNPFKNLFPPNNLMSVFDNLNQNSASVNPIYVLEEQVSNHEITQEEMDEALNKKSGKIWDKALKIAAEQNREELSNPITMASMMLSPSMILSEAFGTKPKDNLPITKTGIAVRSFGKRVGGVLEPVSDILAKALEAPERLLRGNNFSYYGRWGDYIIKRAIASKVADHSASYEEGITAMATMKGTTYEDATRRVEAELSMKLPGSSLANTLADQAWTNIPQALITTMFPTGLYPKGEMDLMGLTEQMQAAWDEYSKGNPFPIDDLLQKHPELLVKSGINDEPELLMKKLLINNIREKYDALDSINKGIIKQQLGDAFVESLLSGKIDYDNITKEDLLIWTDAFGEQLPEGEQIPVTSKLPGVETFTDDQVAEISGYLDIREQRYPNHAWLQQNYAAITDPIEKKKYLAKFPELTHYWDWNKEYKHAHPIIDQWSAYYGNAGTAYQDPYFGLNKNIIQGYLDKKAELFPNITWQQEVYFNLITDEERYAFLDANPDLAKAWDWDAKMEASNPNIKMYKQLREAQFAMYQSQPETETGEEHTPAEQSRRLSLLGLHPYVVQELLIYKANKTPYSSGTKSVLERLYVAMGKPTETLEEFINSLY